MSKTRLALAESGFNDKLDRVGGVRRYLFEEDEEQEQVGTPLTHPKRLRDYVFTAEPVARVDSFIGTGGALAMPVVGPQHLIALTQTSLGEAVWLAQRHAIGYATDRSASAPRAQPS